MYKFCADRAKLNETPEAKEHSGRSVHSHNLAGKFGPTQKTYRRDRRGEY